MRAANAQQGTTRYGARVSSVLARQIGFYRKQPKARVTHFSMPGSTQRAHGEFKVLDLWIFFA